MPPATVRTRSRSVVEIELAGRRFQIEASLPPDLAADVEEGAVSARYGVAIAAPRICFRGRTPIPVELGFAVRVLP